MRALLQVLQVESHNEQLFGAAPDKNRPSGQLLQLLDPDTEQVRQVASQLKHILSYDCHVSPKAQLSLHSYPT